MILSLFEQDTVISTTLSAFFPILTSSSFFTAALSMATKKWPKITVEVFSWITTLTKIRFTIQMEIIDYSSLFGRSLFFCKKSEGFWQEKA